MNSESNENTSALKNLRQARKPWIDNTLATMKSQHKNLKAIRQCLETQALTVPEVAKATDIAPERVLWYLAAMKKYGEIVEAEKDDAYFRYRLVPASTADSPSRPETILSIE